MVRIFAANIPVIFNVVDRPSLGSGLRRPFRPIYRIIQVYIKFHIVTSGFLLQIEFVTWILYLAKWVVDLAGELRQRLAYTALVFLVDLDLAERLPVVFVVLAAHDSQDKSEIEHPGILKV